MINFLELTNFKGYRSSGPLDLSPLTLLVGPNNSGKSSIIHSLLLLKQTLQDRESGDPLITSGPIVDLGSFHEILRGGRAAERERIEIDIGIPPEHAERLMSRTGYRRNQSGTPSRLKLAFAFDRDHGQIVVSRFRSVNQEGLVEWEVQRRGTGHMAASIPNELKDAVKIDFTHFFPRILVRPGYDDQKFHDLIPHLEAAWSVRELWASVFEGIRYIGPIRSPVPRYNLRGRTLSFAPGSGGEQLQRMVRSADTHDGSEGRLISGVDEWVSERFGLLEKLRVVSVDDEGAIRSLVGDEVDGYTGINVANMGEGLSQLLPIAAEAQLARSGDLLVVEQPEIHLHPRAQADLGDLFVHQVHDSKRVHCLVETHSEHLLLRIRRRIAEGVLPPEDVSIFYVEKSGGESTVRKLDLDKKGHFSDWPEGFFEEGYHEALRLAEAASAVEED